MKKRTRNYLRQAEKQKKMKSDLCHGMYNFDHPPKNKLPLSWYCCRFQKLYLHFEGGLINFDQSCFPGIE